MDYIPDKTLFKAVMFARRMMREGTAPPVANTRAAAYYGVPASAVARYTGQVGGRTRWRRWRQRRPAH
jgi:hypothetical protein